VKAPRKENKLNQVTPAKCTSFNPRKPRKRRKADQAETLAAVETVIAENCNERWNANGEKSRTIVEKASILEISEFGSNPAAERGYVT
jgi:hypothetical protein